MTRGVPRVTLRTAMRVPFESESNAFRIAFGVAALAGVAIAVGVLLTPLAGAMVFLAGGLAAALYDMLTPGPAALSPLREAVDAPHPHGTTDRRHVLVIANEALSGHELRDELRQRAGASLELDVLAPILTSRLHFLASDYDRERAEAQRRLDAMLAWAADQGFVARGEVGDPDPVTAIADELRDFGADEVIVVTHPNEHTNWLEPRMVERLEADLDVPVTHVVVDRGADRVELATD